MFFYIKNKKSVFRLLYINMCNVMCVYDTYVCVVLWFKGGLGVEENRFLGWVCGRKKKEKNIKIFF